MSAAQSGRITQFSGGGDVPMGGVIVLHRSGVLALFAADQYVPSI
jgi:hypothetical protein